MTYSIKIKPSPSHIDGVNQSASLAVVVNMCCQLLMSIADTLPPIYDLPIYEHMCILNILAVHEVISKLIN